MKITQQDAHVGIQFSDLEIQRVAKEMGLDPDAVYGGSIEFIVERGETEYVGIEGLSESDQGRVMDALAFAAIQKLGSPERRKRMGVDDVMEWK